MGSMHNDIRLFFPKRTLPYLFKHRPEAAVTSWTEMLAQRGHSDPHPGVCAVIGYIDKYVTHVCFY